MSVLREVLTGIVVIALTVILGAWGLAGDPALESLG